MTGECRNYCKSLKQLDKPYNRAGLPHIKYRIGTFSDFREFILQELDRNQTLSGLTYRNPDDPSIALLEGAALLGDILTFYQELYVNEAFLRTAKWKESIAALVRLTGYRFSPGLGGTASVAFEVKEGADVTIPRGFPVKALLEGDSEPADFETDKEIVAIPALGKFRLYRKTTCPSLEEKMSVFSILTSELEAAGQKIETKDRLLFFDMSNYSSPPIVIVKKVEKKFDRTYIYIEGHVDFIASPAQVTAYKLGRTFRHFGHNAPPFIINLSEDGASKQDIYYNRKIGSVTETTTSEAKWDFPITSFQETEIPLEGDASGLALGSCIIISGFKSLIKKTVTSIASATMIWGVLTGIATKISFDGSLADSTNKAGKYQFQENKYGNEFSSITEILNRDTHGKPIYSENTADTEDIRNIIVYETIGEPFDLENIPEPTSDPEGLYYFGDLKTYSKLQNRRLALQKNDGAYAEITAGTGKQDKNVSDQSVTFRRITYSRTKKWPFSENDFQLDNPTVDVYGNIVEVMQGKKQKEVVLGNGDAREVFQTFKLPKSPLTYIINEAGECEPRIEIYVNDRMWKRVATLLGCKPLDEVYVVREDDEGTSWVQFGDGKTGRKLPTGSENVTAIYWTGIGAHGEMEEDTYPQAGDKLNRLEKVVLPGVVSGGCGPENGEKARLAAPEKVQSLDRLVSLKDFEVEALAIPGVEMASADYDIVDGIPSIMLTVLMKNGREKEIQAIGDTINRYNICRGTQRYSVSITEETEGKHLYVYIDADVGRDSRVKWQVLEKKIREALGAIGDEGNGTDSSHGLFSAGMRGFGEYEYATRIEGVIQNVDGVVWVKVRGFSEISSSNQSDSPLDLSTPSPPILNSLVKCDKNVILCLHVKHLSLHDISTDKGGNCK